MMKRYMDNLRNVSLFTTLNEKDIEVISRIIYGPRAPVSKDADTLSTKTGVLR